MQKIVPNEFREISDTYDVESRLLHSFESIVVQYMNLDREPSWWFVRRANQPSGTDYYPLRKITAEEAGWLVENRDVRDLYKQLGEH